MLPTKETVFLPLTRIEKFCQDGYDCCAVVFSPETENNHFPGCPPYISLFRLQDDSQYYFEIPKAIAYYGAVHAGYTMKGRERAVERGRLEMQDEIKALLGIESE